MKLTPKMIGILLIAVVLAFIGFDVYLALDGIPKNTWSARIRSWAVSNPWLPFFLAAGFGALSGHWFLMRNGAQYGTWFKKHYLKILALIITFLLASIAGGLWW